MDDLFDSIVALEDEYIQNGYEEGRVKGRELGFSEGEEIGKAKGFEIGSEIGFYNGCLIVWKEVLKGNPNAFPQRVLKSITQLESMIKAYKLENITSEDMLQELQRIRAKFKVITSILGLPNLVFNPKSVHENKNMSF